MSIEKIKYGSVLRDPENFALYLVVKVMKNKGYVWCLDQMFNIVELSLKEADNLDLYDYINEDILEKLFSRKEE